MIKAVLERCAGIDVGKKSMVVCIMTGPADGEARSETRTFDTTVSDLKLARAWITEAGCTDVMMESTGTYWKPIFNVLEGHVQVALANPQEVKARKGHEDRQQGCLVAGARAAARHGNAELYPAACVA